MTPPSCHLDKLILDFPGFFVLEIQFVAVQIAPLLTS